MPKKKSNLTKDNGIRLSKARKYRNITQERLAELSNYSVQTISGIENGSRRLTLESANTFANALLIRPEYLIGEDDFISYSDLYGHLQNKAYTEFDALETLIQSFGYNYEWVSPTFESNKLERPIQIRLTSFTDEKIMTLIDFEHAKKEMLEFIEFKLQKLMKEGESHEAP